MSKVGCYFEGKQRANRGQTEGRGREEEGGGREEEVWFYVVLRGEVAPDVPQAGP